MKNITIKLIPIESVFPLNDFFVTIPTFRMKKPKMIEEAKLWNTNNEMPDIVSTTETYEVASVQDFQQLIEWMNEYIAYIKFELENNPFSIFRQLLRDPKNHHHLRAIIKQHNSQQMCEDFRFTFD